MTRLDDALLGAPGTKRGWYGDLFLGIHPWLRPVYALAVLVGLGMAVAGTVTKQWGLLVIGGGWSLGGVLYLFTLRGKSVGPPSV